MNPLRASGNRIVDAATRQPVWLRGVVRSGLEYSRNAGITEAEIEYIVHSWGANIIRLPFNQEWALATADYDPADYLAQIDSVIRWAASRDAYALLDLQWLNATTERGAGNFVPPLPDYGSIEVWRQLARRYAGENAVLYDIFNEPHDALEDDPVPLLGARPDGTTFPLPSKRVRMQEWQPWAVLLIDAIRSEHPGALIFVSGINWGFDLSGFPIPYVDGVVYSTHVYKIKGGKWDRAFGRLAADYPVFAGEWGVFPGEEDDFGRDILRYLSDRGIGWTAWSWNDKPFLRKQPITPAYEPTPFGELVRAALREESVPPVELPGPLHAT